MNLRFAEQADIPRLVEMGVEALQTTPRYREVMPANPEFLERYFSNLIQTQDVFFVVIGEPGSPYAMLAAASGVHPLTGLLTVSELLWWVSPEKRGQGMVLLRAMFAWGESINAQSFQVGSSSKRVDKILKRFGFRLLEAVFIKRAA